MDGPISKCGKREKNAQEAEESEKTSFIVVPRLWAKGEGFKVECTIFFAPEEVHYLPHTRGKGSPKIVCKSEICPLFFSPLK